MSRYVCTECGSEYVMETHTSQTIMGPDVQTLPVRCSNRACIQHDGRSQSLLSVKLAED